MLRTLALLLPALMPSWRFFDTIAASPRIEFRQGSEASDWQEFRPRPQHLSWTTLAGRLFWNPVWNETLFLVSCAERLLDHPTDHSVAEIRNRITATLDPSARGDLFQFRLILVGREGDAMVKEIAYLSPVWPLSAP